MHWICIQQKYPAKMVMTFDYECRFARTKLCRTRLKVMQYEGEAEILVFESHDLDSHNHLRDRESPQLSWEQKQAARAQAKMNPLSTVNEMRRNLQQAGNEDEQIPFDKLRNMMRVVRKVRDEICEEYLGGIPQTGKIEKLRMVCHSKVLRKLSESTMRTQASNILTITRSYVSAKR